METVNVFSPHAWGWTVCLVARRCCRKFSPHAWGWTGCRWRRYHPASVFPTRVGVDRGGRFAGPT